MFLNNQKSSGEPPVGLIVLERCQVEKIPNDVRPFCFSLRKFYTYVAVLSKQYPYTVIMLWLIHTTCKHKYFPNLVFRKVTIPILCNPWQSNEINIEVVIAINGDVIQYSPSRLWLNVVRITCIECELTHLCNSGFRGISHRSFCYYNILIHNTQGCSNGYLKHMCSLV